MSPKILPEEQVQTVRRFNRFFTRQIGVLGEGLLQSPYTLAEARIIFELAQTDNLTAADLGRELRLDAGYLSRLLTKLRREGLIEKTRSASDGRQRLLNLTPTGRQAFEQLNNRSNAEVADMLGALDSGKQQQLLDAMERIESILGHDNPPAAPYLLRRHKPGDMGWVIQTHGLRYAQEYGWDESFEALVAQICAGFINNYDPQKERCWIAEVNGERVGSIFCVNGGNNAAKLRMLLVEPQARGTGLGTRLVEECIRFASWAGYEKLILWTNDILVEARHIYQKKGFTLVESENHHSFGHDLVGEFWELPLQPTRRPT